MAYKADSSDTKKTVVYSYAEYLDWARSHTRSEEEQKRLMYYEALAQPSTRYEGDCPLCGFPQGQKGMLRVRALPGEWPFGKLFACPRCWPKPMGDSKDAALRSEWQEQQADAAAARVRAKGIRW